MRICVFFCLNYCLDRQVVVALYFHLYAVYCFKDQKYIQSFNISPNFRSTATKKLLDICRNPDVGVVKLMFIPPTTCHVTCNGSDCYWQNIDDLFDKPALESKLGTKKRLYCFILTEFNCDKTKAALGHHYERPSENQDISTRKSSLRTVAS